MPAIILVYMNIPNIDNNPTHEIEFINIETWMHVARIVLGI